MSFASTHRAAPVGAARARAATRTTAATAAPVPRPPALLLARAGQPSNTTSSSSIDRRRRQRQTSSNSPITTTIPRRSIAAAPAAAADGSNGASSSAPAPLPAPLQRIVLAFQAVPDPMARYKQLLFYAAKLPSLPEDLRTPENKVEGCVSQVWVVPELKREEGGGGGEGEGGGGGGAGAATARVFWRADSDSQLTKGLAALLVTGLSGCTPQEILSVTPEFIEALGLKQSLTPSRNNGFLNMLRKMQRATLELVAAASEEGAAAA
jgi:sulfur transfer protein SufE